MTNAPRNRKTHVIRILGTNRAGDVLQNIWVDVERMDRAKSVSSDDNYQGVERKFRWLDNPDDDDYEPDGNPSRKEVIVKVCNPHSDNIDDPDEWVPIRVIRHMKMVTTSGENNFQARVDRLINDELNESRKVSRRRTLHHDTNIDDIAQAAFDADPSRTAFVVSGDQYQRDDFAKDEDQYVEHEVILYLKHRGASSSGARNMPPVDDQAKQTKLLNQYLIDESEDAQLTEVGANNINPPYRLDPYQNIINVKFKTLYLVIFVSGGNSTFNLFSPAGSAGQPKIVVQTRDNGVKLLDTRPEDNFSGSGFLRCIAYAGDSIRDAYFQARGLYPPDFNDGSALELTEWDAVNNSCPIPSGVELPPGLTIGPAEFGNSASNATAYLYSIPAKDGIISINVSGLQPNDPGLGLAETSSSGSASITARVYSTVRGKKITKLSQLIGDDKKPTEDDGSILGVTSKNQGKFLINVKLDKDPAHVQTDNYGNQFQPYKVTFDPGTTASDGIPPQPPIRLDK